MGSAVLFGIILFAAATAAGDVPAKVRYRPTPDYPAACMPKPGEPARPHKVTVVYNVTSDGTVEDARVRETTDACFNETAIAAVRASGFEPRRVDGVATEQEDLETTFKFVIGETPGALDFDARPAMIIPPKFPSACRDRMDPSETVKLEFDVTKTGDTENLKVIESSNKCFDGAALRAAKQWKYRPKIDDGVAVDRKGVQLTIRFRTVSRASDLEYRQSVVRRLKSVAADLQDDKDPQAALNDLAEIERKYGSDFSRKELALFHQMRGSARLRMKDYRGALDDFRRAQQLGLSPEAVPAVADAIAKLEAIIAAEDSQATPAASEPPPAQPETQG